MAQMYRGWLTKRRGMVWHERWIMANAPKQKKIRNCKIKPSKTGLHLVMTTQLAVKDSSWSGTRQIWWCPSTKNIKLV